MRKKIARPLTVLASMILLLTPIVVKSGGDSGGGGKGPGGTKGPQPTACPPLTDIDFAISGLNFIGYTGYIPAAFNHTNSTGTNNANDNTKYYCKITFEPITVDASCYGNRYTFYWTGASSNLVVKRPSGIACKLTIEYYDPCAQWDGDPSRSRRYWKYSTTVSTSATFAVGAMQLVTKVYGC